ncbi:hypothetical protein [Methylorubrum populi]|nr:hypothetical protein [Methylorubrum populi]
MYFVVDFRKEWTRQPYITFWGPESAGYFWSLPMAGRYTAEELDASIGYHTVRRYVPSKGARVGPWERFGVPCEILEAMSVEPDRAGRWKLDLGQGPIVRSSADVRRRLTDFRYVPDRKYKQGNTKMCNTEKQMPWPRTPSPNIASAYDLDWIKDWRARTLGSLQEGKVAHDKAVCADSKSSLSAQALSNGGR